ncbi:MAG: hypothetical protein ACRC1M_05110 [Methanobacteriaceae archaeon]
MNILFLVNQNHFDRDEASPRQVNSRAIGWRMYVLFHHTNSLTNNH